MSKHDKTVRAIKHVQKLVDSSEPYGKEGQYQFDLRVLDFLIHEKLGAFECFTAAEAALAEQRLLDSREGRS
jgi:hypothetical protein